MLDLNHILFSYSFDKNGLCQKVENSDASVELENKGLTWVNLDANKSETKEWLEKEASYLDHLIIDALTTEETRPRISEFKNGILLILRGIGNNSEDPEDMPSTRIWIDKIRIITVQRREMKAITDIKKKIENGQEVKSSSEFLYNLIYQILLNIAPFLYSANDRLDNIEQRVLIDHDLKLREEIVAIRTRSAIFKRNLTPQKEVIKKLSLSNSSLINDWSKRHFHENLDSISNIMEELEETTNRSLILHTELANILSEKMSRSMYKLSLITLIFLPLTFLTGLFGINLAGIPGSKDETSFYVFSIIMALIIIFQIIFLKKKGWFKDL